jgi:hypothetical protein
MNTSPSIGLHLKLGMDDREKYFEDISHSGDLFLDPDPIFGNVKGIV